MNKSLQTVLLAQLTDNHSSKLMSCRDFADVQNIENIKLQLHLGYQIQQSVTWVIACVLNCCHPARKQSTTICKELYLSSFYSLPNVILPPCISMNCQCFSIKPSNLWRIALCRTHHGVLFSLVLDFCLKLADTYYISLQIILLPNVSQHRLFAS